MAPIRTNASSQKRETPAPHCGGDKKLIKQWWQATNAMVKMQKQDRKPAKHRNPFGNTGTATSAVFERSIYSIYIVIKKIQVVMRSIKYIIKLPLIFISTLGLAKRMFTMSSYFCLIENVNGASLSVPAFNS